MRAATWQRAVKAQSRRRRRRVLIRIIININQVPLPTYYYYLPTLIALDCLLPLFRQKKQESCSGDSRRSAGGVPRCEVSFTRDTQHTTHTHTHR